MDQLVCPHCHSHRIASRRLPLDVVIVMPCPACSELVVMFRRKAIALDRKVLEHGTQHERKMHIATIIDEFLEPGLLKFSVPNPSFSDEDESEEEGLLEADEEEALPPITEREIREFRRIHLRRLDNADYFRRHLG